MSRWGDLLVNSWGYSKVRSSETKHAQLPNINFKKIPPKSQQCNIVTYINYIMPQQKKKMEGKLLFVSWNPKHTIQLLQQNCLYLQKLNETIRNRIDFLSLFTLFVEECWAIVAIENVILQGFGFDWDVWVVAYHFNKHLHFL